MSLVLRVSVCCVALALSGATVAAQTSVSTNAQTAPPNPYALVSPPPTLAQHAMVVSIHHDASDAGIEILKAGGNAVDAAVAVGFALAVVFPQAGNLGGGGFMLVRMSTGQAHFLDYRERAPAAATTGMYLDTRGIIVPNLSTTGYKAIGVPGTVAGLLYAEKTYGRLTLAQVMAPAIRLASHGYILSEEVARSLAAAKNLAHFPESRRIFQRNGNFLKPGERFTQPELARTLQRIAADPASFYKGPMAAELAASIRKGGGLITTADLAAYEVKDRAPLTGSYRGYQIVTAPPPSAGGIVLLEVLNILSGYDLAKMGDRTPQQVHLITEAFRRAYKDRADYLGDPDFVALPIAQLISAAYAAAWRKSIEPLKPSPSATLTRPAGFLPPPPVATRTSAHESSETTHFSVVDAEGNAVSNTYTLNGLFGSGVTAGSLGFLLNNEMDDFTASPGAPNMYGLIQGPANAIAPGKRPLSNMTPTIVLKDGKSLLVLGSPGGATIITTVANDILSILDNGLNVQQAADAPRFHHQYLPDALQVEKAFPLTVLDALKAMGYTVTPTNEADQKDPGVWGDSEMIYIDPSTDMRMGGHDQRHNFGKAGGY
ncbi:MAG TPA: gamma-glutamyltransferase [Acidobacteriaceae bacterium]|jgi:gamma-glutamyltranspeptidase/glutathione hydrolase|nr:gamma-glutamyltransferase [Acidobacteriaceae bacterium]